MINPNRPVNIKFPPRFIDLLDKNDPEYVSHVLYRRWPYVRHYSLPTHHNFNRPKSKYAEWAMKYFLRDWEKEYKSIGYPYLVWNETTNSWRKSKYNSEAFRDSR